MNIIDGFTLGIIQGLTEFIPVSSSGHLTVLSDLLGIDSTFEFETVLNIGTLMAALLYFRSTIAELVRELVGKSKDRTLFNNVLLSTLPVVVLGVVVAMWFEDFIRQELLTVASLIIVGVIMLFAKPRQGKYNELSKSDSVRIGFWQSIALIPGVSRSGITIIGSQRNGLTGAEAARYSFILSIPAVAAAVIYTLVFDLEAVSAPLSFAVSGIIASFLSSLVAIHFMIKFLEKHGLRSFGVYRIIFGLVLLFIL